MFKLLAMVRRQLPGISITDSELNARKTHHLMYGLRLEAAPGDRPMRTTLNIDDQLLAKAQRITGVAEKSALVREALRN